MSKQCVGIDFGGTFCKFVLLDENYKAGEVFQLPTILDNGTDGLVGQMVAGARKAIEIAKAAGDEVVAVGVGSPGPLSPSKGMIYALPNIPGIRDFHIREAIQSQVGIPAALENDANAAAFGEFLCGAGQGLSDMVMLTLGTGVGGGIIIGGKIHHGAHEVGAELGHIVVVPGGIDCGCGQTGCMERYCSARYLAENTVRRMEEGSASSLSAILADKGEIDAKDINEARRAGDELAVEMWDEMTRFLALGCISICRILDPQRIVLAGGMVKAGNDLLDPVKEHFKKLDWSMTKQVTEITIAALGSDAGAIGAAGVAWQMVRGG